MPTYAGDDDRFADMSIQEWKRTAVDQIDDIRGWRQAPVDRALHEGWPDPPANFFTQTSYLCAWIRQHHPNIDPAPLEKTYRAVTLWHADQSAKRISSQNELEATLDLAIMRLQSVERAIAGRMLKTPAEHRAPAATADGTGPRAKWESVRNRLLAMKAAGRKYRTERRLADALHCSPGTVHNAICKTPELQEWRKAAGKKTLRPQSLNEIVTDRQPSKTDDPAAAAAARELVLARLKSEQTADDPHHGEQSACSRERSRLTR
jgi:hypothetical protein